MSLSDAPMTLFRKFRRIQVWHNVHLRMDSKTTSLINTVLHEELNITIEFQRNSADNIN